MVACGQDFLNKGGRVMEDVMFTFDKMLTVDDVLKGRQYFHHVFMEQFK